jgi:hypothetical protein
LRTDKELLDGLEALVNRGDCPGIINDDNGHWAVSGSGVQNVPMGDDPVDIGTEFFVEAKDWKPTIREAIEAYLVADEIECSEDQTRDEHGR